MNIATSLRRAAADHAGQVALRLDEQEIRYARLADTAARFAAHLRAEGLAAGDRIGVFLPNALEYVPALLGIWQAGGVAVPLNYLFPDAALRHAILDSGATHLVARPGDAARLEQLVAGEKVRLLTTGPDGSWTRAIARHEPAERVEPRLDGDDALIMYTSGSTGVPKGVRQTHRNTTAEVEAAIEVYELTAEDHALLPMPLFHVGGLQLGTLPILMRGGQVTLLAKWDALAWIELAQRLRPTYGGLISTMLIDVGNRTVDAPVLLDSFRVLMFGGSRTPSAPIERLTTGIGVAPIEIYGQTEQSGLAVTYPLDAPRRPGSTGVPLEQIVQTRLVPPTGGPDIGPGDDGVGELWVRGDAVTPGYWNRPDANEERWSGGWFRTGDLVSRD
ncbi:MAG: acyl--CoA ligase, partial [Pseudonocardia sp.]|nr:acyl--CoA ligase [Pseudonocardia sp.]